MSITIKISDLNRKCIDRNLNIISYRNIPIYLDRKNFFLFPLILYRSGLVDNLYKTNFKFIKLLDSTSFVGVI